MDLNLSREQQELIATSRRYAERHLGRGEGITAQTAAQDGVPLLSQLAVLGWAALALPARDGGATLVDQCLVVEELGRVAAITPLVHHLACTSALSAPESSCDASLLDQLAGGERLGSIGFLTNSARDEWVAEPLSGACDDAGWRVQGDVSLVPWATTPGAVLLVPARLDGVGLCMIRVQSPLIRAQSVFGEEPRAHLRIDEIVSQSAVVASGGGAAGIIGRTRDVATVLHTAWAIGAAEGALQLSVSYARAREQFGRSIAMYQSVSHRLADMRVMIDAARVMNWEAAWSDDVGKASRGELVSSAKAYADDAFALVMVNAHQVHGAIGFSTEYPLHRFTRILKTAQLSWGSAETHLDRAAGALGI